MTGDGRPRVAIVGGGIAGLSLAHTLLKSVDVDVVVFERSPRAGGNIRTEVRDGYTCEWGPNGFLDSSPPTLDLVRELGLGDRLQVGDDSARRRYIVRGLRLHEVPTGPVSLLRSGLLSWPAKARLAWEPFAASRPAGDETIHAFAARRIGGEAADMLIDPMVSGVFGGDAHALSLRACFPAMWQMETDHGGLVRALVARRKRSRDKANGIGAPTGRLTSFAGGLDVLVRTLADRLGHVVRTSAGVEAVVRTGTGAYRLLCEDGRTEVADAVVMAGGSAQTARIVRDFDRPLAAVLDEMPTASMVVACLGFSESQLPRPLDGFGYLIPRIEGLRTLGCVWDSIVFPGRAPKGHVLMRVMMGGASDPTAVTLDDDRVLAVVRKDLRTILGIDSAPSFVRLIRHRTGIPQYTVGHRDRVATAEARLARHPGLFLAGNAYRGVSINACIADARNFGIARLQNLRGIEAAPALGARPLI